MGFVGAVSAPRRARRAVAACSAAGERGLPRAAVLELAGGEVFEGKVFEGKASASLVPICGGLEESGVWVSDQDVVWTRLKKSLNHITSDDERMMLMKTFSNVAECIDRNFLSITDDSSLCRLANTVSTLAALKADCDTLTSAMVYHGIHEKVLREMYLDNYVMSENVRTIVDDVLWLDSLPSSLYNLDDDNAKLLRQYVVEASQDPRAVLVKLAEVLSTMRSVETLPLYQQHIHALECLQVYVPLAHAVGVGKIMWELEDLCFKVLFPESYAALDEWHRQMYLQCELMIEKSKRQILSELAVNQFVKDHAASVDIQGRTKNLFSTFKKILRDNKRKEEILDIAGIRVIVKMRDEYRKVTAVAREVCLEVQNVITSKWPEIHGRFKDYIAHPKANGYMSLHTTVRFPDGLPLEVQIRTEDMHISAEYGAAGHHFYKGELESVDEVKRFAASMSNENLEILSLPAGPEGL